MKTKPFIIFSLSIIVLKTLVTTSSAQMVVSDPSNLAQSVVNTARTIEESEATRGAVLENVLQTERIYEQTRKYYEYLKTVNSYVKDVYEVKHTIDLASEITELYSSNFKNISSDPIYSANEIAAISFGYSKIMEKCTCVLSDLKGIVSSSSLSMTDKDRLDIIDRCHNKMVHYRKLLEYYTKKVQAVGMIRHESGEDLDGIVRLYGSLTDQR